MLVLTRHQNETVLLKVPPSATETEIRVMYIRHKHGGAKLGFDAPIEVTILRGEVAERVGKPIAREISE